MNYFVSFSSEQVCSEGCCHLSCLSWFKRERNAFFVLKGYLLPAVRIVSSQHGDNSFPLMEIISVTRGDDLNDLWELSPFTKGMLSFMGEEGLPLCLFQDYQLLRFYKEKSINPRQSGINAFTTSLIINVIIPPFGAYLKSGGLHRRIFHNPL